MQQISVRLMRKDISAYKKNKQRPFTASRYSKMEKIEERADYYFEAYKANNLDISGKEKVFALYVNTLAVLGKNDILQKLQQNVNFNVDEYLKKQSLSFWQKLWHSNTSELPYLSAKKLEKQSNFYLNAQKKLNKGWFSNPSLYDKTQKMYSFAQSYISAFNQGKFVVNPEDVAAFREYINIMAYPVYEGSPAQEALSKLENLQNTSIPPKEKLKTPVFKRMKNALSLLVKKIADIKLPKLSLPKFNLHEKRKQIHINFANHKQKLKVAALTTLFFSLSLGLKNSTHQNSLSSNKKENKTEKKTNFNKNNLQTAKTASFNLETKAEIENQSNQTVQAPISDEDSLSVKYNKVLKNYYDETIASLTSEEARDEIYNKIENQLQKGIFTLPQNISKERMAHSYLMYKLYGLKSNIATALDATEKLSDEAQTSLIKDIENAGETGLGVKKIALQKTKKVNHNSIMAKKSYSQQKKHAKNLKELRQMRKVMSRTN